MRKREIYPFGKSFIDFCRHEDNMPTSTEQPDRTGAQENDEKWLEHIFETSRAQFEESKKLTDLVEYIRSGMLLISMTEKSDPCWLSRTHNLGCAHFHHYQVTKPKSLESLNEAVRLLQGVSAIPNSGYPKMAKLFADLQLCFHHRYRLTEQLEDLENSIEHGERARQLIVTGDRLLPKVLSNLANAYHDRYDDLGCDPVDLNKSIDYARLAVHTTTPDDTQLSHRQDILGTALYNRRHSKEDMREAIALYISAVEDDSVATSLRGRRLDNLGAALFILFQADGHIDDLTGAIHYYRLAVAADLETHKEYAERVGNLGAAYFERYEREGLESDLDEAIRYGESAARSEYKDEKHEPKMVDSLARMYHRRFLNYRTSPAISELHDLHEANRLWQRAIDLVPDHRPERAQFYNNLGTGMETLYESTNDIQHLEKAIKHWGKGLYLTLPDDPNKTSQGTNLGHGYNRLFRHTNDVSHQEKALGLFLQSLRGQAGTPLDRMLAGQKAADIAQSREDWGHCADYLAECIELLPKVTTPTNSQEDLEHVLQQLANLGSRAAAVYHRADRTAMESLQALDRCRTVIGGLLVNAKSDLSLLEELHTELAAEYKHLRDSIAQRAFSSDPFQANSGSDAERLNHAQKTQRRLQDIFRMEEILDEIRQQPGFENFQLALEASEILELGRFGPLIYFNVTSLGSHAFLIDGGRVQRLSLPLLNITDLEDALCFNYKADWARRDIKLGAEPGDQPAKQSKFESLVGLLVWLWDVAVRQVLHAVDVKIVHKEHGSLPHIWWVGGGAMALLPLHAAGSYSENSTENTMSYAVSSYATSLKTLHYSRVKSRRSFATNSSKILIVAMPTTPGMDDLEVSDEVAAIKQHCPPHVSVKCLEYPSASEVMQSIAHCSVVHFACHASSDNDKASQSALYLGDGEEIDKLSVGALQPLNHKLAEVAYLSACSTAEIGARNLIDESIHLASTFQLIGFRHVIGTLWSVDDETAVDIATAFYHRLFAHGEEEHVVSSALHYALLSWRNSLSRHEMSEEQQIRLWAPFIHFGP
jgi:hypothetical protein